MEKIGIIGPEEPEERKEYVSFFKDCVAETEGEIACKKMLMTFEKCLKDEADRLGPKWYEPEVQLYHYSILFKLLNLFQPRDYRPDDNEIIYMKVLREAKFSTQEIAHIVERSTATVHLHTNVNK